MLLDDFGHKINYVTDYSLIIKNFGNTVNGEFDFEKMKNRYGGCVVGVHPFDMWVLENYVFGNNIKTVTELGCGSTTYFLRSIGVNCVSYSLADAGLFNIEFIKCDIFQSAERIVESCLVSDMLLIDSVHHYKMAEFYHTNILPYINLPIFIHDWFDNGEVGYSEQKYWVENILNKDYELFLMTIAINKLDVEKLRPMPVPCSAILHKIKDA
jgi:hypothetical protein